MPLDYVVDFVCLSPLNLCT